MTMVLRDNQGNRTRLDLDVTKAKRLGRGGAGTIYQHSGNNQVALKIYHPHFLVAHPRLQEKMESMLLLAPGDEEIWDGADKYIQIAWPRELIEDKQGRFLGYTMPVVDMGRAVMLEQVLQRNERRRAQIREDYRFRVFVGRNLAGAVWKLHKKGHGIVDLKPVNVLVYQKTGFVCLLDCDGYDVQGTGNNRYPADLFTAEYLYPEGHQKKLRPEQVNPIEQDRFSLAVILFQLLNNGLHPYQGIPVGTAVPPSVGERIAEGLYSYGKRRNYRQVPAKQTLHEYFRDDTRQLFDQAFAQTPSGARPSALNWLEHFDRLIVDLQDCSAQKEEHQHFGKGCGLCALSGRAVLAHSSVLAKHPPVVMGRTARRWFSAIFLIVGLVVGVALFRAMRMAAEVPEPHPIAQVVPKGQGPAPSVAPPPVPSLPDQMSIALAPKPATQPLPAPALPKPAAALNSQPLEPPMVLIEAGTFLMGGPVSEAGQSDSARPHRVSVNVFYLGEYAVTFDEYDRFVEATGRRRPEDAGWGRGRHPVIDVSWLDALAYAEWLSQKTGKRYRLPTEAEWEYAARAGTTTTYYWGNEVGRNHAQCDACGSSGEGKQTVPVGSFAPNPWGLYDMLGNVWQWTCSAWSDPYDGSEQHCQVAGNANRAYRGGSWFDLPQRTTTRYSLAPTGHSHVLGFRLARTP